MVQKWCSIFFAMLLITAVSSLTGNAEGADYVGVKKCKACHIKQYKSWKKTTMANSFENLKAGIKVEEKKKAGLEDKDYTADAGCLKCHTTGYGKPGGFTTFEETPNLANVQCESCHGAGADFRTVMKKNKKFKRTEATSAGLVVPSVDNNNCMDCHGPDSPFNEKVDAKYKFEIVERLKNTHEHFPLKHEH